MTTTRDPFISFFAERASADSILATTLDAEIRRRIELRRGYRDPAGLMRLRWTNWDMQNTAELRALLRVRSRARRALRGWA